MAGKSVRAEIITPRSMFFAGDVEMLIAPTTEGQEGFMANHVWCCKLLADSGVLSLREPGEKSLRKARIKGGYIDIKDRFVVYTDEAEWESNKE